MSMVMGKKLISLFLVLSFGFAAPVYSMDKKIEEKTKTKVKQKTKKKDRNGKKKRKRRRKKKKVEKEEGSFCQDYLGFSPFQKQTEEEKKKAQEDKKKFKEQLKKKWEQVKKEAPKEKKIQLSKLFGVRRWFNTVVISGLVVCSNYFRYWVQKEPVSSIGTSDSLMTYLPNRKILEPISNLCAYGTIAAWPVVVGHTWYLKDKIKEITNFFVETKSLLTIEYLYNKEKFLNGAEETDKLGFRKFKKVQRTLDKYSKKAELLSELPTLMIQRFKNKTDENDYESGSEYETESDYEENPKSITQN